MFIVCAEAYNPDEEEDDAESRVCHLPRAWILNENSWSWRGTCRVDVNRLAGDTVQLLRLFLSPTFDNSYVGLFLFKERFSLDRKEDRLWKEMGLACKCISAQEVLKCIDYFF